MALLEEDDNVVAYQEAPASFRWSDGRKIRTCYPTAAARLTDGRLICLLLNRSQRSFPECDPAYAHSVRQAAAKAGYDAVEIWTETEIKAGNRLANALLVGHARCVDADQMHLHAVRTAIDRLGGKASIRDLRISCGLGNQAFRAIIKLIAMRELKPINANDILDDFAVVQIPRS
ncbi:hypothetical protein [Azorhizobium oxalatiphilum]|nr:hypothetical protein [Azorhizobium oxalatiphilum]